MIFCLAYLRNQEVSSRNAPVDTWPGLGGFRMNKLINAKKLRRSLPDVIKQVRRGGRYRAKAVGRSTVGGSAAEHDAVLYGR